MTAHRDAIVLIIVATGLLLTIILAFFNSSQRDAAIEDRAQPVLISPRPMFKEATANSAEPPRQPVPASWIIGTWSKTAPFCDPATMIFFDGDGDYVGVGHYGRFRIAGANLFLWGEVRLDIDAGADETRVDAPVRSKPIAKRGEWLVIGGQTYSRCVGD